MEDQTLTRRFATSTMYEIVKCFDVYQVWVCEFCGTKNEVDIVSEEIPTTGETTYLLTPPITTKGAESATPTSGMEDTLLVFCIDTSGSMCVTTEVR